MLVFFAFLIATFPYADTLTNILTPMGLRLSSRDQGMSFPFGIRMDGVKLDSPADGRALFQGDTMRVTPALLSWLLGSPGVKIRADAYAEAASTCARADAAPPPNSPSMARTSIWRNIPGCARWG